MNIFQQIYQISQIASKTFSSPQAISDNFTFNPNSILNARKTFKIFFYFHFHWILNWHLGSSTIPKRPHRETLRLWAVNSTVDPARINWFLLMQRTFIVFMLVHCDFCTFPSTTAAHKRPHPFSKTFSAFVEKNCWLLGRESLLQLNVIVVVCFLFPF